MVNLTYESRGILDFHTHSNHSDGTRSPREVVEDAKKIGISALALTDHNITSGLEEFIIACKEADIFAIPFGTEIHAELPSEILTPYDNEAPDLVVLGKNPKIEPMKDYQEMLLKDTRERMLPKILEGLKSVGFKIDSDAEKKQYEELKTELQVPPKILHDFINYKDNLEVLIKYVQNIDPEISKEEIERRNLKYINKYLFAVGCPAYAKRIDGFNLDNALQLTDAMNCALFIAHPGGEYGFLSDAILDYYINKKVRGIEVRSYFNTPEQNAKFDKLAKTHNLIRSGGSDYHGPTGAFKIGMHDRPQNQLPKDILEELWFNLPE